MQRNCDPATGILRGRPIDAELWAEALLMYQTATAREVSARFGMSVQTIYNRVVRLKIGKRLHGASQAPIVKRRFTSRWRKS